MLIDQIYVENGYDLVVQNIMADNVDQRLEQFVSTFEQLISLGLFTRAEVQEIIRRRRLFEYSLHSKNAQLDAYLKYIEYETAVMALTEQRKSDRGIDSMERLLSDEDWPRHIHSIFRRATHHFSGNLDIWNLYIEFCQNARSMKALEKVFSECIRFHGHEPEVWLRAARWEMGENNNVERAKSYMEQAIRRIPKNPQLYCVYAETLLALAKQIEARRELHGIEEVADATKAPLHVFREAMDECESKVDVFKNFLTMFKEYGVETDEILAKGMALGDVEVLSFIARNDSNPVAKFKEFLASHPSRALQISLADYFCEHKKGDELAALLNEIEEFDDTESERYTKVLLDCGKIEDAEEMLDGDLRDLTTPTLQRLKLRLISIQTPDCAGFMERAKPLLKLFNTPEMNTDFLLYVHQKASTFEQLFPVVQARVVYIPPEVSPKLLRASLRKFGPAAADAMLTYLLPLILPLPSFIITAVDVVKAQTVVDRTRIRTLHEMNIGKWGKTSTEAWINYIAFEHEQRNIKKMEALRWKAEHTLDDPAEFTREYHEKFCN